MLGGGVCCTHMLCISRWFTLRPKPSLCENGRALGLSVQFSSLYVSLVISSSTFFAKLPYTQPVVSAFASACARLNQSVACVTLQHFQWYSPILTTPDVEHIAVGHPDSSLSTLPTCSHHVFQNIGDGVCMLVVLWEIFQSSGRVANFPPSDSHDLVGYEMCCHLSCRSCSRKDLSWNGGHDVHTSSRWSGPVPPADADVSASLLSGSQLHWSDCCNS